MTYEQRTSATFNCSKTKTTVLQARDNKEVWVVPLHVHRLHRKFGLP